MKKLLCALFLLMPAVFAADIERRPLIVKERDGDDLVVITRYPDFYRKIRDLAQSLEDEGLYY